MKIRTRRRLACNREWHQLWHNTRRRTVQARLIKHIACKALIDLALKKGLRFVRKYGNVIVWLH